MTWTEKWPTEKGWYWFYGWTNIQLAKWYSKELSAVKVSGGMNSMAYVANGNFIYEHGAHGELDASGVWMPMVVPELPENNEDV